MSIIPFILPCALSLLVGVGIGAQGYSIYINYMFRRHRKFFMEVAEFHYQQKVEEHRASVWMFVAFCCAAYMFLGIAVIGWAVSISNPVLIILAILLWIGNWVILEHAKRKPW